MKKKSRILLLLTIICLNLFSCKAEVKQIQMDDWRTEFALTPEINYENDVDLVDDYNVDFDGKKNVSKELQQAIDDVSSSGGGRVFIPKGEYRIANIIMRSNVKLHIDYRAIIRPYFANIKNKVNIFSFGGEEYIENVEIRGIGGRFKIILEDTGNPKSTSVFSFRAVKNFEVTNIHIEDVKVHHPLMSFGGTIEGDFMGPTNGLVSYCSATNSHYGYGLVQMQCARKVHFEKLSGIGGVTLRAETGAATMNDLQRGGVFDVTARYIHCKDGNSPIMISPHSIHNGNVTIENVNSDGCGWGARIHVGFISTKQTRVGLTRGTFKNVIIRNINAISGNKSQLKVKHFKYAPKDLVAKFAKPAENQISEPSPSIGAVLNEANYPVTIEKVNAVGFVTPDITTQSEEQKAAAIKNSESALKEIERKQKKK